MLRRYIHGVLLRFIPKPQAMTVKQSCEQGCFDLGRGLFSSRTADEKACMDKIFSVVGNGAWNPSKEMKLASLELRLTPQVVLKVLKRLPREEAYRFFLWSGKYHPYRHRIPVYNYMLRAVSSLPDYDSKVSEIMAEMETEACLFDERTFRIIIELYGRAGKVDQALAAFRKMENSVCRPNTPVCSILVWSAMINDLKTAVIFHKMIVDGGYKLAPSIFRQLFRRLCDTGEEETALSIFHSRREQRLEIDDRVYGKVIAMYLKRDQEEEALELLNLAKQRNCSWDSMSYTIARELLKADKVKSAQTFLCKTCKKGCKLRFSSRMIRDLCEATDFQVALDFLEGTILLRLIALREVYSLIVNKIYKSKAINDWGDRLVSLLLFLESRHVYFDLDYHTQQLLLLCDHGLYSEAFKLINFLIERQMLPGSDVCNKLLEGLLHIGEIDEANQLRISLNLSLS